MSVSFTYLGQVVGMEEAGLVPAFGPVVTVRVSWLVTNQVT